MDGVVKPQPPAPEETRQYDVVVVGGGIVGLACARELLRRRPGLRLAVLEKEPRIGAHQTSHNSGVIHAGVYYEPGSLKARLCVLGAHAMYEYCAEHDIPVRRAGKLIVASTPAEVGRLRALEQRARRNGVSGLRWLRSEEIADVEPHTVGMAALHSPNTGIVDYGAVAEAIAEELRSLGGTVILGHPVASVTARDRRLVLRGRGEPVCARHALFCAGAWSDRLAVAAGAPHDPRIIPFRGAYRLVRRERRHLVRGMVYPVPDPALPFLGVHLTRHIDGRLSIGPTALLAAAVDGGGFAGVRAKDLFRTVTWPGTVRMAWRMRAAARAELRHAILPSAFLRSAEVYVPELAADDLRPGFFGVRAQALRRDGTLVDDFVFSHTERAVHVRNAPSPAATSSLAIAGYVADEFERRFADELPSSALRAAS